MWSVSPSEGECPAATHPGRSSRCIKNCRRSVEFRCSVCSRRAKPTEKLAELDFSLSGFGSLPRTVARSAGGRGAAAATAAVVSTNAQPWLSARRKKKKTSSGFEGNYLAVAWAGQREGQESTRVARLAGRTGRPIQNSGLAAVGSGFWSGLSPAWVWVSAGQGRRGPLRNPDFSLPDSSPRTRLVEALRARQNREQPSAGEMMPCSPGLVPCRLNERKNGGDSCGRRARGRARNPFAFGRSVDHGYMLAFPCRVQLATDKHD